MLARECDAGLGLGLMRGRRRSSVGVSHLLGCAVASARGRTTPSSPVGASTFTATPSGRVGGPPPFPPGAREAASAATPVGHMVRRSATAASRAAERLGTPAVPVLGPPRASPSSHGRTARRDGIAVAQHGIPPRGAQRTQVRLPAPLGRATPTVAAGGRRLASGRDASSTRETGSRRRIIGARAGARRIGARGPGAIVVITSIGRGTVTARRTWTWTASGVAGRGCRDVGGGLPKATEGVAATNIKLSGTIVVSTPQLKTGHLPLLACPLSASGGSHIAQASGMHGAQYKMSQVHNAVVVPSTSFVQALAPPPHPLADVAIACV